MSSGFTELRIGATSGYSVLGPGNSTVSQDLSVAAWCRGNYVEKLYIFLIDK